MTTIAIRDGIAAFDSRFSEPDGLIMPLGQAKAILGVRHRVIYVWAGVQSEGIRLVRNFEAMQTPPWRRKRRWRVGVKDIETDVIVLTASGEMFCIDDKGCYEATWPYLAGGSGKLAAYAAMDCGRNAAEAVEIACKYDAYSGLPVNVLRAADL